MEPLSAVANIAQVISLADTIWRLGKETHRIIRAVKNVPQEISQLGLELQEVDVLLLNVRKYCQRYQEQHPLISKQESSPLVQIYITLQSLQAEYNEVSKIVAKELESPQLGKRASLKQWGGKFKLVLGGKLASSSKNLKKYKSQLSINLQVLSSLNELSVNDRLENIHHAVLSIQRPSDSRSVEFNEKESAISTDNALHEKGLSLRSINSMMEQLKTMRLAIEESGTQYEQYLDCWIGDSQHIERAALPLSLLKAKIKESLSLMMDPQPGHSALSEKDAEWIRADLESLLATSHETAAVAIRNPSKTPSEPPKSPHVAQNHTAGQCPYSARNDGIQQAVVSTQFLHQDAPAGKLSIRVQWSKDSNSELYASEIILMLAPKPELAEHGILISLSRYYEKLQVPQITRQLSSYAVVEPSSPAFACVQANDIHGLRSLLQRREVTPTARTTENESLLSYAARHLRLEICELLLNEGADPTHCRWDGANAIYDVRNAFWYRSSDYSIPRSTLSRILRLFVSAGCDINSVALGGSPLHFTVGHTSPGAKMIDESEIQVLVDLLVCLGCDIEHRNADGLTPLLFNAIVPRWHGVAILRALLQWGANPHATTNFGEGALHLAIAFSDPASLHGHGGANSLESRLVLLLRAGCDPALRDVHGHSPSDFAMGSPKTWFQWCMAVERAGCLSMESMMDIEDDGLSTGASTSEETTSGLPACADVNHIFLDWDGFFPWSAHPVCADCGRLCDLQYISRRKRAAWAVFKELRAQFKGR
ncbi:ankyrin repeat protein [Aspergillus terreus]|uniref:Ankyrin repeat protein n=1 Tax=Aspergillus terreus TaxID=33178 RepID=A0A5M3YVD0_ASPTE|nr:hypothetical protein ATETN484_0004061700 [Aspergillus terreus]GFF13506.1 ankyrin repeat protein [Aspergillus terreus]